VEFTAACGYNQTPDSVFAHGTICSIRTPAGRATIAGNRFIETTAEGRCERLLVGAELGRVLLERFAVRLDDAELAVLAQREPSPLVSVDR
jgi:N-hydroxyarylamine O-acetyltransferase